jgi:hypothetical protein
MGIDRLQEWYNTFVLISQSSLQENATTIYLCETYRKWPVPASDKEPREDGGDPRRNFSSSVRI